MTERATSAESREEEIRQGALRSGATVCGIASAERFESLAPEGLHPADLLPNARSVVVVGGAAPRAGEWMSPSPDTMATGSTSDRINSVARKLAQEIERRFGYYGLFVPPGTRRGRPFLDVALAAEIAGLASRSLAGPVLHPEHGFLYYAGVVTTMPLAPDEPLAEPVCPAPSCVEMWEKEKTTPCLRVCPIDDGGCLGGRLESGRVAEASYDQERCRTRVYTSWIPGFQKTLEAAMAEPDRERRKMLLYGDFFTSTLWSITFSAQSQGQCFECMRVCPVGRRELK